MLCGAKRSRDPGTISSGLLHEVQENREDGWSHMVQLYAPLVYYWCAREGIQAADAEDIVQEVFRTVARRVGDFVRVRPQGTFRGWLRTIARNKIGNYLKQTRRRNEFQKRFWEETTRSDVGSTDSQAQRQGRGRSEESQLLFLQVLEMIRAEFEEQTWRVFWRFVADDVPARQVAEEMGISVNAVYLAKSRVLRRVRDEVNGYATVSDARRTLQLRPR